MENIQPITEHLNKYHTGERNIVSSRELETAFQIRGPELRNVINAQRGQGFPICSTDKGYFYAETEEELQRTIRQLQSRIKKIAHAERGLTKAQAQRFPDSRQIALPLEGGDDP